LQKPQKNSRMRKRNMLICNCTQQIFHKTVDTASGL
jgi:hypothetical protein